MWYLSSSSPLTPLRRPLFFHLFICLFVLNGVINALHVPVKGYNKMTKRYVEKKRKIRNTTYYKHNYCVGRFLLKCSRNKKKYMNNVNYDIHCIPCLLLFVELNVMHLHVYDVTSILSNARDRCPSKIYTLYITIAGLKMFV